MVLAKATVAQAKSSAYLTLSAVRTDCSCREWLMYIKVLTLGGVTLGMKEGVD